MKLIWPVNDSKIWVEAVPRLLLVVFLALFGWEIQRNALSFAGGADSSGYLYNARLLIEGELYGDVREIGELPFDTFHPTVYQPLGFHIEPKHERLRPSYPFGLPLLLAFLDLFVGTDLSVIIGIALIAVATPLGVYLLSRELGLSAWWALCSAILLSVNPVYVFMALSPMSDALSTCLGVYCVYFSLKVGLEGKRASAYAILVGFIFAWLVITRLSNGLFALPILVALACREAPVRRYILIILGGLPGLVFFTTINTTLYGGPFKSGYVGHFELFQLEYFWKTARHFAYWIWTTMGPVIVVPFVLSIFWIRKNTELVLMLWLWTLSIFVLYAFYYHSSETWWYLRFILPGFPAVVICGMATLQYVSGYLCQKVNWRPIGIVIAGATMIFGANWGWNWTERLVHRGPRSDEIYIQFKNWADRNAEPEALMVCMQLSGCAYYYLPNPIVRYDFLKPEDWENLVREAHRQDLEIFAPLFMFEWKEQEVHRKRIPGVWELEESFRDSHLYRLDTGATLALISGPDG